MAALLKDTQKLKVSRESLLTAGFDFRYFTHLYKNSRNQEFRICYDFGYFTDLNGNATIASFPENPVNLSLKSIRRLADNPDRINLPLISEQPDSIDKFKKAPNSTST